ncbi:pyridine nucleotide-disulfide oxidoreductase-domain-containing protein [Powellomyces hirtus]|nr:pyridine nucleotide-disulfide oxidoreductase-domain-containing protein [Powellomyces hirtus]
MFRIRPIFAKSWTSSSPLARGVGRGRCQVSRLSSTISPVAAPCTKSRLSSARVLVVGAVFFGVGATLWAGEAFYLAAEEAKGEPSYVPVNKATPGVPGADPAYPKTMTINGEELPVATCFGSDMADINKPRLVILGSGWGATSILKDLDANGYYTVVLSPTNYFLFTPLLPEATTGTTECRSLIESIRKICFRSRAHYCEAAAQDVHFDLKMVEVIGVDGRHFLVPYDKLVIGVGAMNNTFGVPGVRENARFLKDIQDARYLRHKLMTNFETAALPTTSEAERKRLLSFVIAGGGPTGVEYAAELYDFLHEDLMKYFPDLTSSDVSVTIVQSADHILNTFSEAISLYAEERFKKHNINVVTNARVTKVDPGVLTYRNKNAKAGEMDTFEIPFGICLWSTGIGLRDFTKRLVDKIDMQKNKRAIEVDSRLRMKGVEGVYALGDCATIENPNMMEIVKQSFVETGKDSLDYDTFQSVIASIVDRFPQTAMHLEKLQNLFEKYDLDKNRRLDMTEIAALVDETNKKLTSLPATAQVARQQGEYMAKKLNKLAWTPSAEGFMAVENTLKPFNYKHLGSFSYVGGDSAVIDLGGGRTGGGFGAFLLWRGAYLAKQVSLRTRVLLALDWTKSRMFGRDITRS